MSSDATGPPQAAFDNNLIQFDDNVFRGPSDEKAVDQKIPTNEESKMEEGTDVVDEAIPAAEAAKPAVSFDEGPPTVHPPNQGKRRLSAVSKMYDMDGDGQLGK